jgi:hypothetical protein
MEVVGLIHERKPTGIDKLRCVRTWHAVLEKTDSREPLGARLIYVVMIYVVITQTNI